MKRELVIDRIKSLLSGILPKEASAFLFGSQARGDFNSKSDWDILILLNKNGNLSLSERGYYSFPIYKLGSELGIDINPVIYTNHEWTERNFTPFYKNVTNDRIKIWG